MVEGGQDQSIGFFKGGVAASVSKSQGWPTALGHLVHFASLPSSGSIHPLAQGFLCTPALAGEAESQRFL